MFFESQASHVSGENRGNVFLFALSTCGWCRKTKELLNELGVEYSYIDVDLLDGTLRENVIQELERWNQRRSFFILIINDNPVIGFQEAKTREELARGTA
jgi:glutaredoxin